MATWTDENGVVWDDGSEPAQAPAYSPTPDYSTPYQPPANQQPQQWTDDSGVTWGDPNAGQYYYQPPPDQGQQYNPWQPQQQQPAYQPTYNDFINWTGNLGQAQEQPADYGFFGNLGNAISEPWQAPAQQNQDFLGSAWDFASRGAQSALGGLGQAVQPIGGATDQLADSGIWGVSQAAQGVRAGWEQVANPIFTATPGLIGELAKSVDTGGSWNPLDWKYNAGQARQDWEANDPQLAAQRAYDAAIAGGKSATEAQRLSQREYEKMQNPLNRAFQGGAQNFGTLNPVFQLAAGFLDPVANAGGELLLGGKLPAAQRIPLLNRAVNIADTRLGRAAENIGQYAAPIPFAKNVASLPGKIPFVADAAGRVGEAIKGPQAKQNFFERNQDALAQEVKAQAETAGKPVSEIYDEILNDPASPLSQQLLPLIDPAQAEIMRTGIDMFREQLDTGKNKNPLTGAPLKPGEQRLADLANQRELIPGSENQANRAAYQPRASTTPEADVTMAEFFPETTRRAELARANEAPAQARREARPDSYKAVKVPGQGAEVADFQRLFSDLHGLKIGAKKLEGTLGKPVIRDTLPLEQFGVAGKALRGIGQVTLPWMSRLYLNSPGRVWRDTLGNYAKALAGGYKVFGRKQLADQYSKIFGSDKTPNMGGSIVSEAGGKKAGKSNFAANAAYTALNPAGEIGSALLRKASGGKYQDFNSLTEASESSMKAHVYRQERLRQFYKMVDEHVKSGQATPEVGAALKMGEASPEAVGNFVKGIMPAGADLGKAMTGDFHYANFSPEVMKFTEKVWADEGGDVGAAIKGGYNSLPALLDKFNQDLQAKYDKDHAAYVRASRTSKPIEQPKEPVLITPANLTPEHQVFKQMEAQVNKAIGDLYGAQVLAEKADPAVQQATRQLIHDSLQYMAQEKNLSTLKRRLAVEQGRAEGLYKTQYAGKDLYDQLNEQKAEADKFNQDRARLDQNRQKFAQQKGQGQPATQPLPAVVEQDSRLVPNYPISKIEVDPERFQYKHASGEGGTVGSLKGVTKYNKDLAGVVQLWRDPANGKTYMVNGHNRLDLAKRTGQKTMDTRFIEAKDATEARAKGALTNIAEGQGTPIDAAKYFRDTKSGPEALQAQGLKLDGKIANDGLALANLAPALFDRVARYEYPLDRAITIGKKIPDHALQLELNRLLDEAEKGGKRLTDSQVSQLADQVAGTKAQVETQTGLFGKEDVKKFNLVEKAKLADVIASKIAEEKREFGAVAKNRAGLERGGNIIDREKSGAIADQARQAADLFNIKKTQVGPISNILNDMANRIRTEKPKGSALAKIQTDTYEQIRAELNRTFDKEATPAVAAEGQQPSLFDVEPTQAKTPDATQEPAPAPAAEKTPAQLADEQRAAGQQDMFGGQPEPKPVASQADMPRLSFYYDRIYGEGAPGNILSPGQLRQLASKIGKVDNTQRTRYFNNILDTDQYIRQTTGNTFKLDMDTLTPMRIADNQYLTDLLGKGDSPKPLGAPLPKPLPETPATTEAAMQAVKDRYGDQATRRFADMTPAERDLAYSEISKMLDFPDPTNASVKQSALDEALNQATAYMEALKTDIYERRATHETETAQAKADQQQALKDQDAQERLQEEAARQLSALRSSISLRSGQEAMKTVDQTYFNYQSKNVLDQALSGLVPFGFWGRRNFAYVARHMAEHPMHFAALLNFYKELEQQNAAEGIPDYARGNLFLWQNPDGSKVLWNFQALNPFNPVGNSESFMQVIDAGDDSKSHNKTALAMLFGSDRTNAKGDKVTGRDLGLLPTFFKPNPLIDWATKTGKVSDFYKLMGWTGDGFGSPAPEEGGIQKQTTGLVPGRGLYQDIGAFTGATQALRKMGIIPADLDIEGPINEILFGKNAGKPNTKIFQELTSMTQRGQISPEQAKQAIAAYKQGSWTPEALQALDASQAENAGRRLLTTLGFASVVTNTPREQLSQQLGAGYGAVAGDKDKTSQFFKDNPAASVAFSGSKSADQINQGLTDDKTRASLDKLYADQKAGRITSKQFNLEAAKLQAVNPNYASKYPDQAKGDFYETTEQYKNIGGAKYDALSALVSQYMDAGDKKTAGVILGSAAYKQAKAARDQFAEDHPDWYTQYKAENEAKYGAKPATTVPAKAAYTPAKTSYSSGYSSYLAKPKAPAKSSYAPAPTRKPASRLYVPPPMPKMPKMAAAIKAPKAPAIPKAPKPGKAIALPKSMGYTYGNSPLTQRITLADLPPAAPHMPSTPKPHSSGGGKASKPATRRRPSFYSNRLLKVKRVTG